MRQYILSVRGADSPSFYDPLEFKSDSLEEVMQIIDLMLRNGHAVSVLSKEINIVSTSDAPLEAVAQKQADKVLDDAGADPYTLDEAGNEAVEALAG